LFFFLVGVFFVFFVASSTTPPPPPPPPSSPPGDDDSQLASPVSSHNRSANDEGFPDRGGEDVDEEEAVPKERAEDVARRLKNGVFRGRRVVVFVASLDMSKGIPQALLAMEALLSSRPGWRGVATLALAVRDAGGRENSQLRTAVDGLVGHVNGRFGKADYCPVLYVKHALAREELIALYSIADVALVASVREGINISAMEFVACKSAALNASVRHQRHNATPPKGDYLDNNNGKTSGSSSFDHRPKRRGPRRGEEDLLQSRVDDRIHLHSEEEEEEEGDVGVLVYSEFAGCASSFADGAVVVNPYDAEGMARALHLALTMNKTAKHLKHHKLARYINTYTAELWGTRLLRELRLARDKASEYTQLLPLDVARLRSFYERSKRRLLIFEHEALVEPTAESRTFSYVAGEKNREPFPPALSACLEALCADESNTVYVLSGRRRADLGDDSKSARLGIVAEFGSWLKRPAAARDNNGVVAAGENDLSSEGNVEEEQDEQDDENVVPPTPHGAHQMMSSSSFSSPAAAAAEAPAEAAAVSRAVAPLPAPLPAPLVTTTTTTTPLTTTPLTTTTLSESVPPDEGGPGTDDSSVAPEERRSSRREGAEEDVIISDDGVRWERTVDFVDLSWMAEVLPILEAFTRLTPGSFLEVNEASLVWRYRDADADFGPSQAKELQLHIDIVAQDRPVRVVPAPSKFCIVLQPSRVSKGRALRAALGHKFEDDFDLVFALGDERADDDIFDSLEHQASSHAFTCTLGRRLSRAAYFLDPDEVLPTLQTLAAVSTASLQSAHHQMAAAVVAHGYDSGATGSPTAGGRLPEVVIDPPTDQQPPRTEHLPAAAAAGAPQPPPDHPPPPSSSSFQPPSPQPPPPPSEGLPSLSSSERGTE